MKYIHTLLKLIFVTISFNLQAQAQNLSSQKTTVEIASKKIVGHSDTSEFVSESQHSRANASDASVAESTNYNSGSNIDYSGETQGDLTVSLTGSANYNIPIVVPPGIKAVAPQISLAYSSQSSNGLAGWGWNISGLSSISRVGATEYYDGFHDGIDFKNDRYALDGQRLILKSGIYGKNGSIYETENYSNIKIVAHGSGTYGDPLYFILVYPDGNRAWYGGEGASNDLEWAIKKWEDPQGNFIEYHYNHDSYNRGLLNISRILYGGKNGATASINEITFIYKNRSRKEHVFIGRSFTRSKLLHKIHVKSDNTFFRRYNLAHDKTESLEYEILKTVQEFNSLNKAYSPLVFNYDYSQSNLKRINNNIKITAFDRKTTKSFAGDFDGDGFMDIVLYNKNQRDKLKIHTKLSDGELNNSYVVSPSHFDAVFSNKTLASNGQVLAQDGITVVKESISENANTSSVRFRTFAMATYGPVFQYDKVWNAPTYSYRDLFLKVHKRKIPKKYLSGDFDGDGLTDVLAITKPYSYDDCEPVPPKFCDDGPVPNNVKSGNLQGHAPDQHINMPPTEDQCIDCNTVKFNHSPVHFIDLGRDASSNFSNSAGYLSSALESNDRLQTADFNGDGRIDILHFKEGAVYVYTLNADKQLELIHKKITGAIKLDMPILIGDFNGDGKTDFMTPHEDRSYRWNIFTSNGVGYIPFSSVQKFEYIKNLPNFQRYNYVAQDYNGDGKTDIITHKESFHFYHDFPPKQKEPKIRKKDKIVCYENVNSNLPHAPQFKSTHIYSAEDPDSPHAALGFPVFMDLLESDGRLEYCFVSTNNINTYELSKSHRKDVTLKSIKNSGVLTKIEYETMGYPLQNGPGSGAPPAYSIGWGQLYPYVNVNYAAGYQLVKKLVVRSNSKSAYRDFYYKGAVSHVRQGFLGFTQTKRSNWYGDGVGKLWTISNHDPSKKGAVTAQWVSTSAYESNNYISKTTTSYLTTTSDTKVFTNLPKTIVLHNKLKNTTHKKEIIYDQYNNIKAEKSIYNGGNNIKDYTYDDAPNPNDQNYHIGRIKVKIETNTIGSNSFTTETQWDYNNNLVKHQKTRANGSTWNHEHFEYDNFGNITKKTLNANGVAARAEHFKYDDSGRFLIESTDIEGLNTTFSYDLFGNLKTTTNPYGQTSIFDYDGWQRLVSETNYLGKKSQFIYDGYYSWWGFGKKTKHSKFSDGREEITTYNPRGWITKTELLGFDGKWTSKFYEYDAIGRNTRESEPTFSQATQWNTVSYDQYGRELARSMYNGQTVSIDYSGLTVKVDDGTKTVVTTKDGGGNVIKLQDPGGTIRYTYYGNGTMATADYGEHVVKTKIDDWGRKIELIDPTAGQYTYKYNSIGELLNETTPKGKTTYKYDDFGKLSHKTIKGSETDMSLTYIYDNVSKLLTDIQGLNARTDSYYNYHYKYDDYYRLKSSEENNNKARFVQTLEYDNHGRVYKNSYYTKHHSSNTDLSQTTYNHYDESSGVLNAIKGGDNQKILWELKTANHRGQPTHIQLGNGHEQQREFDDYGYLKNLKDHSATKVTTALHLEYEFDAQRGNLLSRSNINLNWNESFTYDSMDRLTDVEGPKQRHQDYDARGRITKNSIVGVYNYASDLNYQLKDISLNGQGKTHYMDAASQDIVYNAYKKPVSVVNANKGRVNFDYGVLQNRSHAYYGGSDEDKTQRRFEKHYSAISPLEIEVDKETGNVKILNYIGGDAYSAPIVYIKQTNTSKSNGYHYLHRDYLGSILAITNTFGNVLEQRQFGAWGSADNYADKKGNVRFGQTSLLNRGYTGHEHFFEIALIHMNGRMYDANLGRFLSPDNYIQEPFNTQNFNRYGYVLNNPLKYTDASGEFFWIAVIIGAFMGGANAAINGGNFGEILLGALIGGAAAGIGAGVANLALGGAFIGGKAMAVVGFWNGALAGAAGGFAAGFSGAAMTAWSNGANFGDGLTAGARAGVQGALIGAAVGGITGGIRASKQGKGFWSGLDNSRPQVSSVSELTPYGVKNFANSKIEANFEVKYNPIKAGGRSNLLKSPTGYGMRNDAGGLGHYNAPRGNRLHGGIDFSSVDGQDIISPIDGKVRNFIGSTSGKPMLEIIPNNPNLGFNKIQMLYVDPPNGMDFSFSFRNISAGDVIGNSVNLQSLGYSSSVGPHVHLQMFNNSVRINPTTYFFFK